MKNDSRNKAIHAKKEGSYSFLTKKGFRVDAPGHTSSEAYKVARSKMRHHSKRTTHESLKGDKLSGTYFKYDREGLHSNEGKYYQHRPSSFKKASKLRQSEF